MELNVAERGVLLSILPKEGNFDSLKVMHELKMHLSFSEDEHEEIKFSTFVGANGQKATRWENDIVKDVPITKSALRLIEDELKALDGKNKLPAEAFSVYEKFIEDA